MIRRNRLIATLLAGVVLALAGLTGCGSDDNSGNSLEADTTATDASAPTNTSGSSEDVVVASSGGSFDPGAIYKKAAPGVVTIISVFGDSSDPLTQGGQGSGFVISTDGEILTNAHVVTTGGEGAAAGATGGAASPLTKAKEIYVEFADGNQVSAAIKGIDPDADVALIKVDPDGLDLNPLELSNGKDIAIGAPVAAIGSPFGEERSLSVGIISATDRTIQSLSNFSIDGAIQTDAAINPGNSGGPLLDSDARVLGINQQIESDSGSNSGVGFAVPISAVRYSLDQLRSDGKVEYAFVGVTTQSLYPQLADELGIDTDNGALVSKVEPDSPADKGGLKGGGGKVRFQAREITKGGDTIIAIDGKPVTNSSDVARLIADDKPGQTIDVEVIRGSEHKTLKIKLEPRPGS